MTASPRAATGGSDAGSMSSAASSSRGYASAAGSYRYFVALGASVASSPVNRWTRKSFGAANHRVRSWLAGSCSRSQTILGSIRSGVTRPPGNPSASNAGCAWIRAACSLARTSLMTMPARTTSPSRSSATRQPADVVTVSRPTRAASARSARTSSRVASAARPPFLGILLDAALAHPALDRPVRDREPPPGLVEHGRAHALEPEVDDAGVHGRGDPCAYSGSAS